MSKKMIILGVFLLLPLMASAQLKTQSAGLDMRTILRYGTNPIGWVASPLFRSDRFHMTQSYSFSLGSIGGTSFSQAVYLNTMSYRLSDPLTLSVQWGLMLSRPFGGNGKLGLYPNPLFKNGLFFSGAQLRYEPSENTQIMLEVRRIPYHYNYYWYRPEW